MKKGLVIANKEETFFLKFHKWCFSPGSSFSCRVRSQSVSSRLSSLKRATVVRARGTRMRDAAPAPLLSSITGCSGYSVWDSSRLERLSSHCRVADLTSVVILSFSSSRVAKQASPFKCFSLKDKRIASVSVPNQFQNLK